MNIANKRIFERKKLGFQVYLNDEFNKPLVYLPAADISLGGLFLQGKLKFKKGTLLFLSFKIKKEEIKVTAEVARISNDGIGVKFVGLSRAVLNSFLQLFHTSF